MEGRGNAFERLGPQIVADEIALDQPLGRRADDDGIGGGQPLEAGRNIRGVSQRELFLPSPAPHLPHHGDAGVDPHAEREGDRLPLCQATIEGVQRLHQA